jgi:hypothetical protein
MESAFFTPRARQSLGAYRIPRETGILIHLTFDQRPIKPNAFVILKLGAIVAALRSPNLIAH